MNSKNKKIFAFLVTSFVILFSFFLIGYTQFIKTVNDAYKISNTVFDDNTQQTLNPKTSAEKDVYAYFEDLYNKKKLVNNNSYDKYKADNLNQDFYENIDSNVSEIKAYNSNESNLLSYLKDRSKKEELLKYLSSKNVNKSLITYLSKKIKSDEFIDSKSLDDKLSSDTQNFNNLLEYINYLKVRKSEWSYESGVITCNNSSTYEYIDQKNKELGIEVKVSLQTTKKTIIPVSNNSKNIPILMYHAVSDETWGIENLFIKPDDFEKQMKYISDNGYETIFVEDIQNDYSDKKVVILTFDDGYTDFYTNAFPILKKYNLKANLYVITNYKGTKNLSDVQIKEISNSGIVSIGSHTANHYSLTTLSDEALNEELKSSKEYLEKLLDKKIRTLCYPSGKYNSAVIKATSKYYDYALAIEGKVQSMDSTFNRYAIKRYRVYRKTPFETFEGMIKSAN